MPFNSIYYNGRPPDLIRIMEKKVGKYLCNQMIAMGLLEAYRIRAIMDVKSTMYFRMWAPYSNLCKIDAIIKTYHRLKLNG